MIGRIPKDGNYKWYNVVLIPEHDGNSLIVIILGYSMLFCIYSCMAFGIVLTVTNFYSLAYSLSQISGSIIYHLLLLFHEEVLSEVEL
jgi:hypothetical protein